MRLSKLFFKTFKENPNETEIISHQLLERAGYIRKLGKGLYIYTPLMWKVIRKISQIVREEMEKAGAQEVSLPLLHPKELWEKTGRWADFTAENLLYTLEDREGHEFCLAPTHEEVMTYLVSNWVTSYKQLPLNLFQIGPKFRDEIRPRFGLMRGKEFVMKDGYSFSDSPVMMEKQYEAMRHAYSEVFRRLSLNFVIVTAHGGKIGKGKSEEFQVVADIGEDLVMVCQDYASNVETTEAIPPPFTYASVEKEKKELPTPNVSSITDLAQFLNVAKELILKTMIYKLTFADKEEFVAIGIRGDRQVNEVKVGSHFSATEVALATDAEILGLTGSKPGFIGPLNLKLRFYADKTCKAMKNFVCAANIVDIHFINVNWGRDLPHPECDDFLLAEEGDECPHVEGGVYKAQRGIEVGHIFNLGTKYSEKLEATFQAEDAKTQPLWMGTYGIGIGRVAAAMVEQLHDEKGIIWPLNAAPFKIFITFATSKNPALVSKAEEVYTQLLEAGLEPLLDDRDERLGFKLKDSDLLGIPFKIIVGKSFTEEGKLEIESRKGEKQLIDVNDLLSWAHTLK